MTDGAPLPADPSPRLEAAFRAVAERMRGLSFVNPAVEVEAVGFAPWDAHWLGVMVTPWFMNLMLLPGDAAAWQAVAPGAKRRYAFPAGTYEFIGGHDAVIGDYQACSLFSPLLEFADHASARLVATLARAALFDPAHAEVPTMPVADLIPGRDGKLGTADCAAAGATRGAAVEARLPARTLPRGRTCRSRVSSPSASAGTVSASRASTSARRARSQRCGYWRTRRPRRQQRRCRCCLPSAAAHSARRP